MRNVEADMMNALQLSFFCAPSPLRLSPTMQGVFLVVSQPKPVSQTAHESVVETLNLLSPVNLCLHPVAVGQPDHLGPPHPCPCPLAVGSSYQRYSISLLAIYFPLVSQPCKTKLNSWQKQIPEPPDLESHAHRSQSYVTP